VGMTPVVAVAVTAKVAVAGTCDAVGVAVTVAGTGVLVGMGVALGAEEETPEL